MADFTPKLSYTSRDAAAIEAELKAFILETRPDLLSDFFDSNTGMALVKIAALVGDMLSVGQDITAQELFLATCQRYDSALRFARSVGYVPRSATPAEVTVKSIQFPDALIINGGSVPAGSAIKGQNGLTYELLLAVAIAPGDTVARLSLIEGTSYTEEFQPASQKNQVITSSNGIVADESWTLFIGDPSNPANKWVEVENVQFESSPTQSYDVYFDGSGRASYRFGDGTAGKIPDDTITLAYRTTNGTAGNSPVSSIRGSLKVTLQSPATGTVSVTFENKDDDLSASGGTQIHNGESLGTTAGSSTIVGTFANVPLQAGTATIVISLPLGGGTITLQDTGAGVFVVVTNTSALTVTTSAITYSNGAFTIGLSAPAASGGTVVGTYFSIESGDAFAAGIIGAASGGDDRETLSEMKRNIPAYIRSQDKILTLQDYNDVLRRLSGIALVFTDLWLSSYSANAVKVHIWSDEIHDFYSEDSSGILAASPATYTRYAQVQQDRVNDVQAYLAERTLITVHNIILRPTMLWADIYLGTVDYDKRLKADDVRAAIQAAAVAVFEASDGFTVYLSEVVNAIRDALGVKHFLIERIATGTQETGLELQGSTLTSPTTAGTLLAPTITPKSVTITIEQTASSSIVLKDNGAGQLVLFQGTAVVVSSSIDYLSGAWTVTFTANLIPNQNVYGSYANVLNDYRRDQIVRFDDAGDPDNWPTPGVPTTTPATPPYKDGVPLTATRAGSAVSTPYIAGDNLTYDKLKDISVDAVVSLARFFDDTYLYNNEIFYDSVDDLVSSVLSINLRRLVFDLNPV